MDWSSGLTPRRAPLHHGAHRTGAVHVDLRGLTGPDLGRIRRRDVGLEHAAVVVHDREQLRALQATSAPTSSAARRTTVPEVGATTGTRTCSRRARSSPRSASERDAASVA